jgi:hypothetical protein
MRGRDLMICLVAVWGGIVPLAISCHGAVAVGSVRWGCIFLAPFFLSPTVLLLGVWGHCSLTKSLASRAGLCLYSVGYSVASGAPHFVYSLNFQRFFSSVWWQRPCGCGDHFTRDWGIIGRFNLNYQNENEGSVTNVMLLFPPAVLSSCSDAWTGPREYYRNRYGARSGLLVCGSAAVSSAVWKQSVRLQFSCHKSLPQENFGGQILHAFQLL